MLRFKEKMETLHYILPTDGVYNTGILKLYTLQTYGKPVEKLLLLKETNESSDDKVK